MSYRKHNHYDYEPEVWDDKVSIYSIDNYTQRTELRLYTSSLNNTYERYGDPYYHDNVTRANGADMEVVKDTRVVAEPPKYDWRKLARQRAEYYERKTLKDHPLSLIYFRSKTCIEDDYIVYNVCNCIDVSCINFADYALANRVVNICKFFLIKDNCMYLKWLRSTSRLGIDFINSYENIVRCIDDICKVKSENYKNHQCIINAIVAVFENREPDIMVYSEAEKLLIAAIKQFVGMYMYAIIFNKHRAFEFKYGITFHNINVMGIFVDECNDVLNSHRSFSYGALPRCATTLRLFIQHNREDVLAALRDITFVRPMNVGEDSLYNVTCQYAALKILCYEYIARVRQDREFYKLILEQEQQILQAATDKSSVCTAIVHSHEIPITIPIQAYNVFDTNAIPVACDHYYRDIVYLYRYVAKFIKTFKASDKCTDMC